MPDPTDARLIVSSSHLADGGMPALSETEFGLILAAHAFERWIVRCMAAAGETGLNATDVMVLHSIANRGRPKRLADLCLVLGIEDTHLVNYAVRKLEKRELVKSVKQGKEKAILATRLGMDVCLRYRDIREQVLVRTVQDAGLEPAAASTLASTLRTLSGHYDQAARAAATL